MRIAKVIGMVVLNHRVAELRSGHLLIAEVLDREALKGDGVPVQHKAPMPQSLVVYDELGAGVGHTIAVSEGGEATMPFYPERVPIDAYCAAILDTIQMN